MTLTFFKRDREACLELTWSAGLIRRDALFPIRITTFRVEMHPCAKRVSLCLPLEVAQLSEAIVDKNSFSIEGRFSIGDKNLTAAVRFGRVEVSIEVDSGAILVLGAT